MVQPKNKNKYNYINGNLCIVIYSCIDIIINIVLEVNHI